MEKSSAYKDTKKLLLSVGMTLNMLLIVNENNIGPITDPLGMPNDTASQSNT